MIPAPGTGSQMVAARRGRLFPRAAAHSLPEHRVAGPARTGTDAASRMKLVERYIFARAFRIALGALVAALAVAWTTQVLARINLVTDSGQTAATFLQLATLLLPTVIPVVIPFAVLIGIAQTLTTMNADSELAVMAAAGSSKSNILRPVLALAIGAGILSFAVDNTLDPWARHRIRQILATAHADLLSSVIQEGAFRKIEDGLFVQVGHRLPNGTLGSIFVADSRTENLDLTYYAKEGEVHRDTGRNILVMRDGEVHRKTPNGDVSVIRFASYAFDLSEFSPGADKPVLFPKDQTLAYLLNPDPNDLILKNNPNLFRAEIHRRFTEWTFPIVFALFAVAVAGDARSQRQARIHPMVTAVCLVITVRWEGYFVANKAQTTAELMPFVYAVPILNSLFASWFIWRNRVLEMPPSWSDRMADFIDAVAHRMTLLRLRLSGHRGAFPRAGA